MTLLVAIEPGRTGEDLLASARMFAHAGGWGVRVVHVRESDAGESLDLPARLLTNADVREPVGDPGDEIAREAASDDVHVLAFSLRSAEQEGVGHVAGHVADALLLSAPRPLLVTRPGMRPLSALKRILLPLEGSPSASAAMRFADDAFCARGRELVALHVGTTDTPAEPGSMPAPRIVDQEQYEWSAWHEEFTMRFSACPEGGRHRTVVRVGDPRKVIASEAVSLAADLLVVTWAGSLAPGRSAQVKALLADSPCPLLLVPAAPLRV